MSKRAKAVSASRAVPLTVKLLLMVVVPEPAPMEIVVAAPARFRLVAPVLNIFALVSVVVISPPLTAIFPEVVINPFDPFTEKAVAVMSFLQEKVRLQFQGQKD